VTESLISSRSLVVHEHVIWRVFCTSVNSKCAVSVAVTLHVVVL